MHDLLCIQGQAIKLSRFSDRHIYPCNGRTGPGKVSLEPHEYKEDFDMSQAKIGHSKLSREQIDRAFFGHFGHFWVTKKHGK